MNLSLTSQRRMAAEILKAGINRVWIDPERIDEIESAITREEIRKFIHEKAIRKIPEKGVSRARARILHEKKKTGKRRGPGSRVGSQGSRTPRKETWIRKIRAQRKELRKLKGRRAITEKVYRKLYVMAKSGSFRSVSDLKRYLDIHNLRRKR
ncbi:MAG: 50S ribosomal protein L19e [Candidatus Bathyarchaeia archaeon]